MLTQYRIVPVQSGYWGVERLEKEEIFRFGLFRGQYTETKQKWVRAEFPESSIIEAKGMGMSLEEYRSYRSSYRGMVRIFEDQEQAEMYIDKALENEKKEKRHMATPPREYP